MPNHTELQPPLPDLARAMKRDWDERAHEDAKWFINTVKRFQSDEEFDATGAPEVARFILNDPLLTAGRDLKTLRFLEIGCGIGRMTRYFADIFGAVHATDVSAEMIRQARARFQNIGNVFFHETSGLDVAALPDNYFDIAFSVYVFQHVPDAEIIRANIRDACRVLKPGGLFKFQTCGITSAAFAELPKNTWTGVSFAEAEIRQAAHENSVRLVSLHGLGTQYCWTLLRKPRAHAALASRRQPHIADFGRTNDLPTKAIPCRGPQASLTLLVADLDQETADANNLLIEINGQECLPHYVGPVIVPSAAAEHLLQINVPIPTGANIGPAKARVCDAGGNLSDTITLELVAPPPVIPQIQMVSNIVDGGLDIYTRGAKAVFRVFVDGLDEAANVDNVWVKVGGKLLKPTAIEYLPANNLYLVIAKLPEDAEPGEMEVKLCYGVLQSPGVTITIL